MNHILDTQQCDHILHGKTMDSIGISTDGKLDNGDDQTITARNGESVLNSCAYYVMMIGTEDQLVYDNLIYASESSHPLAMRFTLQYKYSTSSQYTTQPTLVKRIIIMSIIDSLLAYKHGEQLLADKETTMRIKSFKIWGAINTCHKGCE